MHEFRAEEYGPAFGSLFHVRRVPVLGPGRPEAGQRAALQQLTLERAFGGQLRNENMGKCCLAAAWLYFDFLDESHTLSQEIDTTTGSYWHGLMHRREPDYGNAKYWFRRVGSHPAFVPLAEAARELGEGTSEPAARFLRSSESWDPFAFIDLCSSAEAGRAACADLCRRVQLREWEILFDYCYRAALGEDAKQ